MYLQLLFLNEEERFKALLIFQVEQLELEVAELRQALSDKQEQESAMLQVSIPLFFDYVLRSFNFFPTCVWPCHGNSDCLLP